MNLTSRFMRPILFRVGDVTVWSHEVFAGLGIVVALWITARVSKRARRADRQLLYLVAGGLVGAAIFARFGLVVRYLQVADAPTLAGLIRYGGRSLLGGLVGGYLGIVAMKRIIGYTRATGDMFAPGVAAGMAIGRVGCFLAERPGTESSLPWAVRVPLESAALVPQCPACITGAPMHPSFVYEILFDLAAAWVLFRVTRSGKLPARWLAEGDLFKAFLLAYAVFRVGVEFVRGNPAMWLGRSGSQVTALVSAVVLGAYFARRYRSAETAVSVA